jgi:hypothetical protein
MHQSILDRWVLGLGFDKLWSVRVRVDEPATPTFFTMLQSIFDRWALLLLSRTLELPNPNPDRNPFLLKLTLTLIFLLARIIVRVYCRSISRSFKKIQSFSERWSIRFPNPNPKPNPNPNPYPNLIFSYESIIVGVCSSFISGSFEKIQPASKTLTLTLTLTLPLHFFIIITMTLTRTLTLTLTASITVGVYSRFISGSFKKIQPSSKNLVYQISVSYTFGFIFTNTAFSLGKK